MRLLKDNSKTSAPFKVILFGEHFVVYNKPAILAAINKRVYVNVNIRHDTKFALSMNNLYKEISLDQIEYIGGEFTDLSQPIFIIAYNILKKFNFHLGLDIKIISELPFGSGLGSSAATSAALIMAITNLFTTIKKEDVFLSTIEAERLIHYNTSGADPAIVTHGGLIMFKKVDDGISITPLIYHPELSFIIVYSGISRSTGKVVNNVKLLKENNLLLFERFANTSEEITLHAIEALKVKDYEKLGSLMLKNHELLQSLGVSNDTLDKLVDIAINNGALGAKLTGAGGGGSIIAFGYDNTRLLNAFKDYHAFIAGIDREGVTHINVNLV
jgi:mevalonate kinase